MPSTSLNSVLRVSERSRYNKEGKEMLPEMALDAASIPYLSISSNPDASPLEWPVNLIINSTNLVFLLLCYYRLSNVYRCKLALEARAFHLKKNQYSFRLPTLFSIHDPFPSNYLPHALFSCNLYSLFFLSLSLVSLLHLILSAMPLICVYLFFAFHIGSFSLLNCQSVNSLVSY